MNIGVIIQARLMSERLPSKILLPLGNYGRTVLEQVIRRMENFIPKSQIMVATSDNKEDDKTANLCQELEVSVFRGSENDVLDRYYKAAKEKGFDNIIRICADSPLIDPDLLKQMLDIYKSGSWDYVSNTLDDTYPEGLNAEIFSFKVLKEAWENAKLSSEREHVTPYIKKGEYKKYSHISPLLYSDKRWTLDYEEDYKLINNIYKSLEDKKPYFTTQDVLLLLKEFPEWEECNKHIPRNEGYKKSLSLDLEV